MFDRGDVVQLRKPLGFGGTKVGERFVVFQVDALNQILDTTIGIPLDPAAELYAQSPIAVPVSAREAGEDRGCVAVATHPTPLRLDRLLPGRVGRLDASTLATLEATLKVVLGLP